MSTIETLQREVAALIIDNLNLDIQPNEIEPNAPLFGDSGLALDSIDALEIACVISQHYGCQLTSKRAENEKIFASLASLSEFISQNNDPKILN